MKVAFLGGGSLRLLPLLRGIFDEVPQMFNNGELRFIDLKLDRAEAVSAMVGACPEFQQIKNCKLTCPRTLEEGLKDIDVLYLTMGARTEPTETMAAMLAAEHGFYSSDQLSINGGFLTMRIGKTIMNIARKMEQICPKALMLIFPNPVAVYAGMVNNYTKIRALGICGGFGNHRWDLTRVFFGKNESWKNWNVVAAGVNHCSIILRGSINGEDLYSSLCPRVLTDEWKPMQGLEIPGNFIYNMYKRYGHIIFSTEADGMAHIFPDEAMAYLKKALEARQPFNPDEIRKTYPVREAEKFQKFMDRAKHPEDTDWSHTWPADIFYGKDSTDISIPIFKALGGYGKMRIVASAANRGAIQGYPDEATMEYTMDIDGDTITPVENQYIPAPFQGLMGSLSNYQTLLGKAVAEYDPKAYAEALDAYPIQQFTERKREFLRKMFALYTDMDPHMRQAEKYFN